jgi:hypothetical protein
MMAPRTDFLTRSRLRDVVILLAVSSTFFFRPGPTSLVVSLFMLALGSFIHVLTKGVLIRNEVLCKDGVYGIVRHPYYLANYLIDMSFCLASGNKYLLLCYPFLFFWSYGPTLRNEEKILLEKHGEAETGQMLTTPPLFPDRESLANIRALLKGFSASRVSAKEVARNVRFWAVWLVVCMVGVAVRPGSHDIVMGHHLRGHLLPIAVIVAALGISATLSARAGTRT